MSLYTYVQSVLIDLAFIPRWDGFDRFDVFKGQSDAGSAPNWPPYNIEKVAEDAYRISVVAAGFAPDEIELVQKENELSVVGRKQPSEEGQYLHRGVANRAFKQTFNFAEHVKVLNANLENGVLTIALKREIPEALSRAGSKHRTTARLR
jgi:molecular chaperone IbpA